MDRQRDSKFDLLAVLLLLCVFSALILSVLLSGARTYKSATGQGRESLELQTDALYITKRISQAPGNVEAANEGGTSCLRYYDTIEGEKYVTRIYCHDGWIMELFSADDVPFDPASGEKVFKAESMRANWDYTNGPYHGVLWVEIQTESGLLKLPFANKVETYGYAK